MGFRVLAAVRLFRRLGGASSVNEQPRDDDREGRSKGREQHRPAKNEPCRLVAVPDGAMLFMMVFRGAVSRAGL
jgi:hypothetical protein